MEYLDVPAISKESLRDPAYLASLRVVDAFAHVLRLFEDETIPHEKETVDPVRDLEDVEMATLTWVEWFNNRRIYSALDYVSPAEYEANYYHQTESARAA